MLYLLDLVNYFLGFSLVVKTPFPKRQTKN